MWPTLFKQNIQTHKKFVCLHRGMFQMGRWDVLILHCIDMKCRYVWACVCHHIVLLFSLLFFYHAASLSPSLLLSNHHTCITHAKPSDGINFSTCTFPSFETPFHRTSAYAGASMRDGDGAIHVLLNCLQPRMPVPSRCVVIWMLRW